jgi:Fe-S-cluster containining protein
MPKRDSIDKIVTSYFAAVNTVPFTYKGEDFPVKTLTVSPLLLRGFTCPPMCGGCCPRFTLDYLPTETHPYQLERRVVEFNGIRVPIYSHTQDEFTQHHCSNLNHGNGRCGIHGVQPFSCDFELIRFLHTSDGKHSRALTRLFGRGHAMLRVDGERGALCTITEPTRESIDDAVRKLRRLDDWCAAFKLPNRAAAIIKWAMAPGPKQTLILHAASDRRHLF